MLGTLINTPILIVIDALDSFNQEDKKCLVGKLLSFPSSLSGDVRILVASRAAHGVDRHQDSTSIRLLDIEESQVKRDIDLYIHSCLRKSPKLNGLSQQSMDDLAAEVQGSSGGIFLWAKYVIRDIEEGIVSPTMLQQIKKIPTRMEDVLHDLTACITFGSPGYLIASIIVASEDNLGPQDIKSMFEIESWSNTLQPRMSLPVPVEEYIQRACGPVVTCRSDVVRFYHPFVTEYLLSMQKLSLDTCHAILGAACLKYLSLELFDPNHDAEIGSAYDRFQSFCNAHPFLNYAVKYWSHHFLRGTRGQTENYGEIAVQRLKEAEGIAWMERSYAASNSRDSGSEDYKDRNMEARIAVKGNSDPETIASMIEVALDAQGRGNVVKSQLLFEQVCATSVFKGLNFTVRYQVLSGLSRSYERQNRWQDAEKQYRRCLDDCGSAGPPAEVYKIQTQNSLAWVLKAQGRLSEAAEQYETAYADSRELLGPEHCESRLAADELSRTYEYIGRNDEAKTILLSQLYGCQRTLGLTHPNTIETVHSVLDFHSRQGQTNEAETLCRKLFAESQIRGTPDVSIGQVLSRMLEDRGDLDEAEAILASIMRAHLEQPPTIDPSAAVEISSAFAHFHMRHEAWAAAFGVLERCIDRAGELAFTKVGKRLGLLVAKCKEELGRLEEAQAEYERLFHSEVENPGWTSRTTMEIGHEFAAFYERRNNWDKALEKYMQVQESFAHALGPAHRYTVDAGKALAAYHERRKDWQEAGRLYDDIQRHLMVTRGSKHRSAKETWTSNQRTRLHRIEV